MWIFRTLGALLVMLLPFDAHGQQVRLAHIGQPGSIMSKCADAFAQRVNGALSGKTSVTVFGAGQLGRASDMLPQLQAGIVQLSLLNLNSTNMAQEFDVFDLPFLVDDRGHVARIREQLIARFLQPAAEKKGFSILGMWETGFRDITTNSRPVVRPADMKGLKLRVAMTPWSVSSFTSLGAQPSPLPFREVFPALQSGLIDSQESTLEVASALNIDRVQKNLSITRHIYQPVYLLAESRFLISLDAEVRQVIAQAAVATQDVCADIATRTEVESLERLRARMATNFVRRQEFREACQPIYREFSSRGQGTGPLVQFVAASIFDSGTGGGGDACNLPSCKCENRTCSNDCCKKH